MILPVPAAGIFLLLLAWRGESCGFGGAESPPFPHRAPRPYKQSRRDRAQQKKLSPVSVEHPQRNLGRISLLRPFWG